MHIDTRTCIARQRRALLKVFACHERDAKTFEPDRCSLQGPGHRRDDADLRLGSESCVHSA